VETKIKQINFIFYWKIFFK